MVEEKQKNPKVVLTDGEEVSDDDGDFAEITNAVQ